MSEALKSIDTETLVVGACLTYDDSCRQAVAAIGENSALFANQRLSDIYAAIHRLSKRGVYADMHLTASELIKTEGWSSMTVGQISLELVELSSQAIASVYVEEYVQVLKVLYAARRATERSSLDYAALVAGVTDPVTVISDSAKFYSGLLGDVSPGQGSTFKDLVIAHVDKVGRAAEDRRQGVEPFVGFPSGIRAWDRVMGGFCPGQQIVIAARPGMGKTSIMMNIARGIASQGVPVGILSGEMTKEELVARAVSEATGISVGDQRRGYVSEAGYKTMLDKGLGIAGLPIHIEDRGLVGRQAYRAKAAQLASKHGVRVLFGDYLQLMADSGSRHTNREQAISELSREGKLVAKEYDLCNVWFSQLNRAVESRGGAKRPGLADLRESGAIEQDADAVVFIYRPEYYQIPETEDGRSTRGLAELIVAKNRQGALEIIELGFDAEITTFMDYSDYVASRGR